MQVSRVSFGMTTNKNQGVPSDRPNAPKADSLTDNTKNMAKSLSAISYSLDALAYYKQAELLSKGVLKLKGVPEPGEVKKNPIGFRTE